MVADSVFRLILVVLIVFYATIYSLATTPQKPFPVVLGRYF